MKNITKKWEKFCNMWYGKLFLLNSLIAVIATLMNWKTVRIVSLDIYTFAVLILVTYGVVRFGQAVIKYILDAREFRLRQSENKLRRIIREELRAFKTAFSPPRAKVPF